MKDLIKDLEENADDAGLSIEEMNKIHDINGKNQSRFL